MEGNHSKNKFTSKKEKVRAPHFFIKYKFLVWLSIFIFFILVLVTANFFKISEDHLEREERNNLEAITEARQGEIISFVEQDLERVALIASRTKLRWCLADTTRCDEDIGQSETIYEIIEDAAASVEAILNISILNTNGIVVSSLKPALTGENLSDTPLFTKGTKESFINQLDSKNFVYKISTPLLHPQTKALIGVAIVEIKLSRLKEILSDYAGLGETGGWILGESSVDNINVLCTFHNKKSCGDFPIQKMPKDLEKIKQGGTLILEDNQNHEFLVAYRYIEKTDWFLISRIETEEAFAHLLSLKRQVFIIVVIFLFFSTLFAYLIYINIRESKKTEKALQKSEEKYRLLTELSPDCIKTFDLKGNLLFINKAGIKEHKLGSLEKALRTKWKIKDTLVSEDLEKFKKAFARALKGKNSVIEVRHTEKGSIRKFCSESISPIKNNQGEVTAIFCSSRDITEERELDSIKNEFITIASHQLRTPLTGIRWVIERFMKKMSQFSKVDKEYLRNVQAASIQLTLLVDQLLNVSRIESGKIGIVPKKTNIVDLVKGAVSEFTTTSMSRKNKLVFTPPKGSITAHTDSNAVRNIIRSILSNAVEYTPEKGIIKVNVEKTTTKFVVSISDTGIGIPKKEIPKLFTKFHRSDSAKRFKPGGTGLGLYIAKQATDLLGGKISVKSKEKKGTEFKITLPLHTEEKKGEKEFV